MNLMQPYVQKNTKGYQSILSADQHIYEYYAFEEEPWAQPVNAVPDGCVDLLYAIGENDVRCFLGGTVLKMKYWPFEKNCLYFGLRFYPGQSILPKDVAIEDIINADIEIPANAYGTDIGEQLYTLDSIEKRAALIHQMFDTILSRKQDSNPKEAIESYIRNKIYATKGTVSVKEIADETGYSECYVRRAFHEFHGISPKTFEKIVRFQNTLAEMTTCQDTAWNDIALDNGYYDQSHMVKEFKTYTGFTPENYMKYMKNV